MASLPKPDPVWIPMKASELLAIRGTPLFIREYERQRRDLTSDGESSAKKIAGEFYDGDVPGWTYDAEL